MFFPILSSIKPRYGFQLLFKVTSMLCCIFVEGFGDWSRPLRVWCKDSEFHDEVVKTRTNTLTVQLVSDIYWEERIVFVMGYWTAPKGNSLF